MTEEFPDRLRAAVDEVYREPKVPLWLKFLAALFVIAVASVLILIVGASWHTILNM